MALPNDIDLLNPPPELEKRKRTRKPKYTLMCQGYYDAGVFHHDVKCQGCFNITTVSSHSQTVVVCGICQTVLLCPPTGGRARLTELGCFLRRKGD